MIRSLFPLLLVVAVAAQASGQTAPAGAAPKTTKARPAKSQGAATKPAQPTPQAAANSSDGQNAYAAPGMPVNVDNPKKVGDYNGDPVGKPARRKAGTTLTPR